MGTKLIDLAGKSFGRLTAIRRVENSRTGAPRWPCRCSCGSQKVVQGASLRHGDTRSCGCLPRCGEHHSQWKGGRTTTKGGYVLVRAPGHPRATRNRGVNGYVFEHILVMEKALGRLLRPGETVHHRKGIKNDNRLGELELWVTPQPHGVRASDVFHEPLFSLSHEDMLLRYTGA